MASGVDVQRFYDNPEHSDLAIKLSHSDREIKVHRLILCSQSNHFKRACENCEGAIEIDTDDEDALEIMLRAMYGIAYEAPESSSTAATVAFHIRVALTAEKFEVHDFAVHVATKIENTTQAVGNVQEALEVLKTFPQVLDNDHVLASQLVTLVQNNLRRLAGNEEFTCWLASQPHVHQAVFKLIGEVFGILDNVLYVRCWGCRVGHYFDKNDDSVRRSCNSCRGRTTAAPGDLIARAFGNA